MSGDGAVIYSEHQGPIGVEITIRKRALMLFSAKDRNQLLRSAMMDCCTHWLNKFLPLRFTDYVFRPPFYYPDPLKWNSMLDKANKMGVVDELAKKYFDGFNPWGKLPPRGFLFERWLREQKANGKYKFTLTGLYSGAKAEYRKFVKQRMRALIEGRAESFRPLVLTGGLLNAAITQSRAIATAKKLGAVGTIKIPTNGPKAAKVNKILRTLPRWEITALAKVFGKSLGEYLLVGRPTGGRGKITRTLQGAASLVTSRPSGAATSRSSGEVAGRAT